MSFELEIARHLADESVISYAKIGVAPGYEIPTTGDAIVLTETLGLRPVRNHNETRPILQQPSMQVSCRAIGKVRATALARAAYNACCLRDTVLSGTRYLMLDPQQEPFPMGLDESKRVKMVFNIMALKTPS